MSQENVEIVRTIVPAGTDYKDFFGNDVVWTAAREAAESSFDPDVEAVWIVWGQVTMQSRGLDGLRKTWLDWLAPWTSYYEEIEDIVAVGDDRVVVLGREHGHRRDTETEVAAESAGVYFLRDGKITRVEYYAKRAEALEAVGLSE